MSELCPCCSGLEYSVCCLAYLSGIAIPPTPEALMRSRYTAYATKNVAWLLATWHPSCHAENFRDDLERALARTNWLSLQIIEAKKPKDYSEGFVTFIAHYREDQRESFIYERSRFLHEEQRWYYIEGTFPETGRNSHCPCASGKKFKKCCGR